MQPAPSRFNAGAGLQPANAGAGLMPEQVCNLLRHVSITSMDKTLRTGIVMPSRRISKELNTGIYFLTMTVNRWYYLFDRHNRWKILADSIRFCQENKGLKLHAYVFMLNHIHLIVASNDVAGFVRDFKKFTSKQFRLNLERSEPQVLSLFIDNKGDYQFWMKTNAPKKIENGDFYWQKIEYIHNNPVRKGYVVKPEHWLWSSANPNSPLVVAKLET